MLAGLIASAQAQEDGGDSDGGSSASNSDTAEAADNDTSDAAQTPMQPAEVEDVIQQLGLGEVATNTDARHVKHRLKHVK